MGSPADILNLIGLSLSLFSPYPADPFDEAPGLEAFEAAAEGGSPLLGKGFSLFSRCVSQEVELHVECFHVYLAAMEPVNFLRSPPFTPFQPVLHVTTRHLLQSLCSYPAQHGDGDPPEIVLDLLL